MKAIINSDKLVSALTETKKVITNNPVIPILENWLLEVKGGWARVTATDLQNTLIKDIGKVESKEDFACLLAPPVLNMLKKFDFAPVTLEFDPGTYSVILSNETDRTKFAGDNTEDFPKIESKGKKLLQTNSAIFNEFSTLLKYVSTDELRPALTSLNFGYYQGKFNITTTDGHTLAVVNVPELNKAKNKKKGIDTLFNISAKAAKILSGYEVKKGDPHTLNISEVKGDYRKVIFEFGDITLVTRTIEERYPDYPSVIPDKSTTVFHGVKADFLKQLDKAMICANKTTWQIRIDLRDNEKLKITSEDLDFINEFGGYIQGTREGKPLEIGFNGKLLAKVIESAPANFEFHLSEPNKAGVLKTENKIILVMPVMLNRYA